MLVAGLAGCGPALPKHGPERALYLDLRKSVELRESDDWVADRLEVDDALTGVMRSICQVPESAREDLLDWVELQALREGGPAEEAFARTGERDAQVRELLRLERIHALLAAGDRIAAEDCPFWLQPDEEFAGVQGDARRFVILGETVGGGTVLLSEGETQLGGGGGARVMPGFGITDRLTLAAGIELGASGVLAENESGAREFRVVFSTAIPVLLRIHQFARVIDLEVAATTRWVDGESRLPPGIRFGIGYGLSTMRLAGLMPYGLAWVGYEVRPKADDEPREHVIWVGTRVGFDWDP